MSKKRECKIIADTKIKQAVLWPGQANKIPLATNDNSNPLLHKNRKIKIVTGLALVLGTAVSFMLIKFSTKSLQTKYLVQKKITSPLKKS